MILFILGLLLGALLVQEKEDLKALAQKAIEHFKK